MFQRMANFLTFSGNSGKPDGPIIDYVVERNGRDVVVQGPQWIWRVSAA